MASSHDGVKMVITKTETEYNMKSIRFLLLTITAMFIIIGILMTLLGISVYTYYHSFEYIEDSYFTPSIMTVFLGALLVVIASFGFFGSLRQSTCAVNFYALILTVMLILKLVLVIMAFTTNPNTIASYIHIPVEKYTTDLEVEKEIDFMQVTLNCCGSNSYRDYTEVEFTGNHSTLVVSEEIDGGAVNMLVPRTCCSASGDEQVVCVRLRTTGCGTAIVNAIVQNASVLGVLGVSVMFIELLGIIFALMLARCIRKLKSQRAFMAWKIREQLILAQQEEQKERNALYIIPQETSAA